jgi:hypothetical protein
MNRAERNEKIEEYGRGTDLFSAALAGAPRQAWEFKPAANEWSIHEIIVHMRDSENMGVLRLHKLIAEPGSTVMPYAEDKWTNALNYALQDVDDALQIFKLTRRITYRLLKTLPDGVFTHSVVHPEWDKPYTVENWLDIYRLHVPEHIDQLQKTYQAWKEGSK